MNLTNIAKVKTIADHYGVNVQLDMLVEECAELIQAVQKVKRFNDTDKEPAAWLDFTGELADVAIMLEQMKYYLTPGLSQEYEKAVIEKLDRQLDRIEKENNDGENN